MVVLGPRCMRGGKNRPTIWVKISKKLTWVRKNIYIPPPPPPPPLKNIIPLYLGGWKCSKNRSVKNVIRRDSTNTVSVISVSQKSHTRVGIRLLLILIIRKWWHYSSRAVEEEVKESLGVSLLLRVAARQASIKTNYCWSGRTRCQRRSHVSEGIVDNNFWSLSRMYFLWLIMITHYHWSKGQTIHLDGR